MVNAQEWLNNEYSDKKTEKIYINQQLEGILDCSGYDNLYKIFISSQIDSGKFEIKNAFYKYYEETKIIHCIQAQE